MIGCYETSDPCNAMVGTNMLQLKVAEHILLGFGHGNLNPGLLLELLLLYVTFIVNHDRHIRLTLLLMNATD
eukprot:4810590-Prorocentrum_lima.AAC.1